MKFEDYKLDASICEALHTLGYESPLPVQEAVIPLNTDYRRSEERR